MHWNEIKTNSIDINWVILNLVEEIEIKLVKNSPNSNYFGVHTRVFSWVNYRAKRFCLLFDFLIVVLKICFTIFVKSIVKIAPRRWYQTLLEVHALSKIINEEDAENNICEYSLY